MYLYVYTLRPQRVPTVVDQRLCAQLVYHVVRIDAHEALRLCRRARRLLVLHSHRLPLPALGLRRGLLLLLLLLLLSLLLLTRRKGQGRIYIYIYIYICIYIYIYICM